MKNKQSKKKDSLLKMTGLNLLFQKSVFTKKKQKRKEIYLLKILL